MILVGTLSDVLGFSHLSYYYVVAGNFNPSELVLAGTALEAVGLLFEVPTGVLADCFSRRLSIIIGIGLMGLSTLGQSIAPDFALIIVCQGMRGFAYTFITGADKAWLADEVGEEAVGPILLFSTQIGQVVGIFGVIANLGLALIDLRLPFVISGLLSLGLMIFLIVAMPERGFVRPVNPAWHTWRNMVTTTLGGVAAVRGRPVLILLLIIGFFGGAASEGYDRLWQSHVLTNFLFSASENWMSLIWLGLINLGGQVFSFVALQLVRRYLDTSDRRLVARLLFISQGLSLVGCLVVGLSGSLEVTLGAVWLRVVVGVVMQPLYDTWLILSIPSRVRATVISMSSQLDRIGQVVVGPGVGALGNAFGTRLAIVTTGFLLLPNLILYARLFAYAQPTGDEPPTPC